MNLREQLLANKPKVKSVEIDGTTYYLREFTVGEMNKTLFGQQQELIRIAEEQGIELNFDDETELAKQLSQVYDKYRLARTLATRLCDENGVNLFDVNNNDDLEALSQLDKNIFEILTKVTQSEEVKNSQPDASSK